MSLGIFKSFLRLAISRKQISSRRHPLAFYNENEDEDELNQTGGVQQSDQSGLISSQGAGQAGQKAASSPDKSGNFVGIQQYLNANKTQAAQLGDQTAGVIQKSADDARSGLNQLNQAASNQIKTIAAPGQDTYNTLSAGAENLSEAQKKQLRDASVAKYTGPNSVSDFGDAYTKAQTAEKKAVGNIDGAGTEEGRMGLVEQVSSGPRTKGMNTFDGLLLQTGGGREKIEQAAKANQGIKGGTDTAATNIGSQINQAKTQTAQTSAEASKRIQDELAKWKAGFQPKVTQAQNDLVARNSQIMGDIGDNPFGLDQATMDELGLGAGQRLYGLDLASYINSGSPTDVNASNVASAEDYARYGALADLAGEQDLMLRPEDASKAGTAPKFEVKKDQLAQDIAKKDAEYKDAYKNDRSLYKPADYPYSMDQYPGFTSASPQELESKWIPIFKKAMANTSLPRDRASYQQILNSIQNNVNKWKSDRSYNSEISLNKAKG
jgi:gas vesicle protein